MNKNSKKKRQQIIIHEERPKREKDRDKEKQYQDDLKYLQQLKQRNQKINQARELVADRLQFRQCMLRQLQMYLQIERKRQDISMMRLILSTEDIYRWERIYQNQQIEFIAQGPRVSIITTRVQQNVLNNRSPSSNSQQSATSLGQRFHRENMMRRNGEYNEDTESQHDHTDQQNR